jgi:hypothetical protein
LDLLIAQLTFFQDICDFYAKTIFEKITDDDDDHEEFVVTLECCVAINNTDHICNSLRSFVKDWAGLLGNVPDELLTIDKEMNGIWRITGMVAEKISFVLRNLLTDGSKDSNSMESVMLFLDSSLEMLHNKLNEVNFGRILGAIWNKIGTIMEEIVLTNVSGYFEIGLLRFTQKFVILEISTPFVLCQSVDHTRGDGRHFPVRLHRPRKLGPY